MSPWLSRASGAQSPRETHQRYMIQDQLQQDSYQRMITMSTHTEHPSLAVRSQQLVGRSLSERPKAVAVFVTIMGILVVVYAICITMHYRGWKRARRARWEYEFLMRFHQAPPPRPPKASLISSLLFWKSQRPENQQDALPVHNVGAVAMPAAPAAVAVNNSPQLCEECWLNRAAILPAYEANGTGSVW